MRPFPTILSPPFQFATLPSAQNPMIIFQNSPHYPLHRILWSSSSEVKEHVSHPHFTRRFLTIKFLLVNYVIFMQLPGAVWRKMALTAVGIKLCVLTRLKLAILLSLYFILPCPQFIILRTFLRKICNILDIPSSSWVLFFSLYLVGNENSASLYTKRQSMG